MIYVLAIILAAAPISSSPSSLPISKDQSEKIAKRIWKNECGGTVEGLTSWNKGEEFASLGIGHFIWYPEGIEKNFDEQFPEFIQFAEKSGAEMPTWLKEAKSCPWQSREAFQNDLRSPKMNELRNFLFRSLGIQMRFLARKLGIVLPKMTAAVPPEKKQHITKMFYRLAMDPNGMYILLDYLNFKGDGTSPNERYNGKGWGLLQVLEIMSEKTALPPAHDFTMAAKKVLMQRVQNSPPERKEERWLKGWFNRIDTYIVQQP